MTEDPAPSVCPECGQRWEHSRIQGMPEAMHDSIVTMTCSQGHQMDLSLTGPVLEMLVREGLADRK